MALQLRTLATFAAPSDIPARAPMPDDAAGYVDFTANLHMTAAAAEVSNASALVFSRDNTPRSGLYYGREGLAAGAHTTWDRIEYDAAGNPLGLLVEQTWTQIVTDAMRTNLALGTAVGAAVAASGMAEQPWAQWYAVTPSGAGEASLTLTTASVTANHYVYIHFDVRGEGVVQVGLNDAGITGFANFDLTAGEVYRSDTSTGASMIRRPGGGWTVMVRLRWGGAAGVSHPYVASVASLTTGLRGASGRAFDLRAPRVAANASGGLPERSAFELFKRESDLIFPVAGLMDLAGDFTCAFRARSGFFNDRSGASLFLLRNGTTSGTEIRFNATNTLIARQTSGNLIVAENPSIRWTPETIYRVGVSRRGSQIAVMVNDLHIGFDTGAAVADATPELFGSWDTSGSNSWSGHLQKCIWWSQGRAPADLAALVDRWL